METNRILRKKFVEREDEYLIPDLISLQRKSYKDFLMKDESLEKQKESGLTKVFKWFFPLNNPSNTLTLDFVSYRLDEEKYTPRECLYLGKTYSSSLYVTLRLIVWSNDLPKKQIKVMKEQEVYLCDIPLITDYSSFIFSGIERIIITQLIKSPGVLFDIKDNKYTAKIIPMNGSWLSFEFDSKDDMFFRLDSKRKLPITSLLRALNYNTNQILTSFYNAQTLYMDNDILSIDFDYGYFLGKKLDYDLIDIKTNEVVLEKDTKITKRVVDKLKAIGFERCLVGDFLIEGFVSSDDVVDKNGELIIPSGTQLTLDLINKLKKQQKSVKIIIPTSSEIGVYIYDTFLNDKNKTKQDALFDIYRSVRTGDIASTMEQAETFLKNILFTADLSLVGRMKINYRLNLNIDKNQNLLTKEDIIETIRILSKNKHNEEPADDVDNLQNRRIRMVAELVENQFKIGLRRIEKTIIEKMTNINPDSVMPQHLINFKSLMSIINDLFATSQLSQFMDQTNALSELSHKRRISSLGPQGLTRERAGFDVRDIHYTQYGKICPIETPEGQNIGLVNNFALFSQVNEYGFITTPYRKVTKGVIDSKIEYLSSLEEIDKVIVNIDINIKDNKIVDDVLFCRVNGEFEFRKADEINYIEISPRQILSVAANLIPFIGNNNSNRALMASGMMRQAVPFARPEFPLVGTGLEHKVAVDSGAIVRARRDGVVKIIDASKVIVESENSDSIIPNIDIYELNKFVKTNNDTTINQHPTVVVGQKVKEGDILTDAQCVNDGELSLGKNILVAFLPWHGYNFYDSIVVSDRLVQDDVFTSIHIEEFEVVARDTQLGPEEITRDIPNVGEDVLRKLDESGIIHIGAEIKTGDILVGKTTPKSEAPSTPEEKLLKVIFGEKATQVKDTSLYVTPGTLEGTVIDVRVFTRHGLEKDERAVFIENQKVEKIVKQKEETISLMRTNINSQILSLVEGMTLEKSIGDLKKGDKLTKTNLKTLSETQFVKIAINDKLIQEKIDSFNRIIKEKIEVLEKKVQQQILRIKDGDDLGNGILKIVKILVASKQRIQPGDKLTGRHGNKGVISRIISKADMPYMEDGTPIDILLTPSGIPSRMCIGQILETHLGWVSVNFGKQLSKTLEVIEDKEEKASELRRQLLDIFDKENENKVISKMSDDEIITTAEKYKKGVPFETGTFENIEIEEIENLLEKSGVDKSGQVILYDGQTGEMFDRPVTVGYMYMLKLHHLVDTKIHARSIGPYSLVTQQPLGGKSHFGGQRFGEMECWALEGYGAAYTLQEMLTVKSDDVAGRVKIYESIIQGNQNFTCGIPESFNVMMKELRSLGLNVELVKDEIIDSNTAEDTKKSDSITKKRRQK
jgi:DNA-directed RNA polymerase subunit beta